MRTVLILDATGSMAGDALNACVQHARAEFPADTPVLMDGGPRLQRTTLGTVDPYRGSGGGGALVNPGLVREVLMAMPTGRVVFYTDGFIPTDGEIPMPKGRVEVRITTDDAHIRQSMERSMPGCTAVSI